MLQNGRIFDVADVPFSQVSDDEKKQYAGKIKETGLYSGYKLREYWVRSPLHLLTLVVDLSATSTSTMESATRLNTSTVREAPLA